MRATPRCTYPIEVGEKNKEPKNHRKTISEPWSADRIYFTSKAKKGSI